MRIYIVGSSAFVKQFVDYRDQLINLGHEVHLHEHYVRQAKGEMKYLVGRMKHEHGAVKKEFDYNKYHYNQILNSDAILVLNFDKNGIKNYIGGNTLIEIGFAHVNNKKVFLLNSIPKEVSYVDEIETMVDLVINDDLSKIE